MNNLYNFGQFVLDPGRRTLSRAESPVFLTPKAFDVLTFLVQNPNRLVTKDELLQAVWGDTFVEEGNLKQYISHLRKALGDNSGDTRLQRLPVHCGCHSCRSGRLSGERLSYCRRGCSQGCCAADPAASHFETESS